MSAGEPGGTVVKMSAAAGRARALAAVTTGVVEEARRRHGTYPTATAALGRTLTGALLLGGTTKGEERLSIELVGDGPLRRAMASTTGTGRVRGYVANPATHLPSKRAGRRGGDRQRHAVRAPHPTVEQGALSQRHAPRIG